jgi:hypothetical protein
LTDASIFVLVEPAEAARKLRERLEANRRQN